MYANAAVSPTMPMNETAKNPHSLPARAGSRPRMYRASSQLCGPANRNTVAMEKAIGIHPARTAAPTAMATRVPASGKPEEVVRGVSRAAEDMETCPRLAVGPSPRPLNGVQSPGRLGVLLHLLVGVLVEDQPDRVAAN